MGNNKPKQGRVYTGSPNTQKVKANQQKRKAKRSEGWQQAKLGVKGLGKDMKTILTGTANQVADLVSGGGLINPITGPGTGPGGAGGFSSLMPVATTLAAKGIKQLPSMAKNTGNVLKGTLKGIFNHPEWYKVGGYLNIPALNTYRPFDPVGVKSISEVGSALGVCHYVVVNAKWNSPVNLNAFKLASIEAFKQIRTELKSNLPYAQEDYDKYIDGVITYALLCKNIEKVLGWYDFMRADIPELNTAFKKIPSNFGEFGKVTASDIAMYSDISRSRDVYRKLQIMISQLSIPAKYLEFINWLAGSVFIDQAAPNAQVYNVMYRSIPRYGFTFDTSSKTYIMEQIGEYDIATLDIEDVVSDIEKFLTSYGIMNADISKTGRYVPLSLASVEPGAYVTNFLNDPEFFCMIINSYTCSKSDLALIGQNSEYLRIDLLQDIKPENTVGVMNGLGSMSIVLGSSPVTILSQAAYFSTDSDISFPRGGTYNGTSNMSVKYDEKGLFYQYATLVDSNVEVKTDTVTRAVSVTATQSAKLSTAMPTTGVADSAVVRSHPTESISWYSTFDFLSETSATYYEITGVWKNGDRHGLEIKVSWSNNTMSLTSVKRAFYAASTKSWTASTPVPTTDWTITYSKFTQCVTVTCPPNSVVISVESGAIPHALNDAFVSGQTLALTPKGERFYSQLSATYTVPESTAMSYCESINKDGLSLFLTSVDYHIPVIEKSQVKVKAYVAGVEDSEMTLSRTPVLHKFTFIPAVVSMQEIENTLYWMFLGLYSM